MISTRTRIMCGAWRGALQAMKAESSKLELERAVSRGQRQLAELQSQVTQLDTTLSQRRAELGEVRADSLQWPITSIPSLIEAPWLVHGGHSGSIASHMHVDSPPTPPHFFLPSAAGAAAARSTAVVDTRGPGRLSGYFNATPPIRGCRRAGHTWWPAVPLASY
jgi:hypothetical protein